MAQASEKQQAQTFTDLMRLRSKNILTRISAALNRMGFTPNLLTVLGLLGSAAAGVLLALGLIRWGGLVALIMVPFDALDGSLARYQNRISTFGSVLDSVLDRYSEIFLFGGLAYYYSQQNQNTVVLLALAAMAGSLMVSYVKARGEAVGYKVNVGLLSRLERMLILIPCLLFNVPIIALGVIAVLANLTAIQRLLYVKDQPDPHPTLTKNP